MLASPLLLFVVSEAQVWAELKSVDIERCLLAGYSCDYAAVEVTRFSYPLCFSCGRKLLVDGNKGIWW